MKILSGLILILALVGCTHSVHQVHTSDFNGMKPGAKAVESLGEQFVVMGFVTQTDYVDQAYRNLQKQCSGTITGITSRYSTSLGFFSWTNKVKMKGYCVLN